MSDLPGALPSPAFVFDDAAGYELMMGRWSALVAAPFLDWLALPDGLDWLDCGCGEGSFTEPMVHRQRPSSVVGVDPAPAQLDFARRRADMASVRWLPGDAQALPLPDTSVDVAVMALVLFFVPDPAQGIRELLRVTRPGGTVAAYHWDLSGGGLPLQPIIDAARAEGYEPQRPPSAWVATPEASGALWLDAGSWGVQTCQFDVRRTFDHFDSFWRTAYSNPRLRDLFASLSPAALSRMNDRVRDQLGVTGPGPLVVRARANAVKGRKH